MKLANRGILGLIVTTVISSVASAQTTSTADVGSTKTAVQILNPKPHAELQFRHYFNLDYGPSASGRDTLQSRSPVAQIRPYIGTTLLDGLVDTTFFMRLNKTTGNETVTQGQSELEVRVNALATKNFSVSPYINFELPYKNDPTRGTIAVENVYTQSIQTGFGELITSASATLGGVLTSSSRQTSISNDSSISADRLALTSDASVSDGQISGAKNDPTYGAEYTVAVGFKPADTRWTFEAKPHFKTTYNPRYAVQKDGSIQRSYPVEAETNTRFRVSYAFSDKLSIRNDFWVVSNGFYEARRNAADIQEGGYYRNGEGMSRYVNNATLSYTIF